MTAVAAVGQYHTVLRSLKAVEIPPDYRVNTGVVANAIIAGMGVVLILYLSLHRLM
jgi:hypothetical protein